MSSFTTRARTLVLALLPLCPGAIHQGGLNIEMEGANKRVHVVALSEKSQQLFTTSGSELTLRWGGEVRGFLAMEAMDAMPVDNYLNFTLFNKEISYDIDLNGVGCSCNAALFFTTMPGIGEDGRVSPGSFNPWYCDANQIGGVWCWEHDTIEGNKHNMATTPHKCNAAPGQYISECDKIGCASNTFFTDPTSFCPGGSCRINTDLPFRIAQRFHADAGLTKLVRISNRLVQGNTTFDWDVCSQPGYLEQMTAAFKGNMTMVFQLWGSDHETMKWLDDMTGCTGECNADETEVTFSNIALRPLDIESEIFI